MGGEDGFNVVLYLWMDEERSRVEILEAVGGNCRTGKHGLDARQGAEHEVVYLIAKLERE